MKNLKKVIIGIFVLIVIIIIILLNLKNNDQNNADVIDDDTFQELERGNGKGEITIDNSLRKVSDKTRYYTVKNIIDQYFEYTNMANSNATTELEKEDANFALDVLMNILSNEYIEEFNITENTLKNNIKQYANCEYNIDSMYMSEKSLPINIYMVFVNIQNKKEPINFIVVTNSEISAFEIYGDEYVKKYKYDDENQDELINLEIAGLKQNDYNEIKNKRVTNQDIATDYFNNYKYNILNNPEKAYELLDKEYREKRFGNLQEYQKYINENKETLKEINPSQYLVNNYENYTEYVCKDQHENLYIFKETAIMDYTVQLDTYTITTDKFKEEYASANNNKKVKMNIDKFIQMINNYDYKSAYEVLNKSFKDKYFKTEEEFKKYMQSNYYRYNDITLGKFSDENGTYIYETTIQNKSNKEEQKEMNIIMKLNEGIDFEMSFEVI